MPETARCYAANTTEVTAKVVDGEAIAVNLTTGTYYSMTGVAARVWSLIEEGGDHAAILAALAAEYDVDRQCCSRETQKFFEQLLAEKLVLAADRSGRAVVGAAGPRRPWITPELVVYRDMADLLALDPPVPGLELAGPQADTQPHRR